MKKTAYPIPLEFVRFLNQILDLPSDNHKKKKLDGAIRDINLVQKLFDLLVKFGGDVLKPVFSTHVNNLFYCKDIKLTWKSDEIPL